MTTRDLTVHEAIIVNGADSCTPTGVLAALSAEMAPARIQTLLPAPYDRHDARVLTDLSGRDAQADGGTMAVVVRCFDHNRRACGGPALVIDLCTRLGRGSGSSEPASGHF